MPDVVKNAAACKRVVTGTVPWSVPLQSEQRAALRLYLQVIAAYDAATSALRSPDAVPRIEPLQRLAHRVVDAVQADPAPLFGLVTVKGLQPSSGSAVDTHGVNTMIVAAALAQAAGLPRAFQVQVALAGLLHDVGRDANTVSSLDGIAASNALLRFGDVEDVAVAAAAALSHDPALVPPGAGEDAALAILRIADAYDTLTARPGMDGSPDLVLAFLLRAGGPRFDAALVRCLARALGEYPPGTTVQLDDGSIAVVVRPAPPAEPESVLVRVCCVADGTPLPDETWTQVGVRTLRSVDPAAFGIDPTQVFRVQC